MTVAPVRFAPRPRYATFAGFGHLGGGGAFGAELTAVPAKIGITQVAGATCTRGLMYG